MQCKLHLLLRTNTHPTHDKLHILWIRSETNSDRVRSDTTVKKSNTHRTSHMMHKHSALDWRIPRALLPPGKHTHKHTHTHTSTHTHTHTHTHTQKQLNCQISRPFFETSEFNGMKNFAIKNRVLQRRVLEVERYYCTDSLII